MGHEMAFTNRILLIKKIEELRRSTVICYLTSVRPNLSASMADDAVRVFFDHMLFLPQRTVKKIDVFLCSNGGTGTVPWRLISLLREFGESVGVLIPYRAYSAATLLALGANEIVMHPFAEMGPIDPSVTNDFNPVNPQTNRQIPISVEDVKAYISFVKSTAGIQHEDEFVKAIEILAGRVHPLALGNVERFISQSRLIARKILTTHMKEQPHKIDEIIEMMASKLYFHGHPINRVEAREELGLKVIENVPPELEAAMWQLYLDYETEFENRKIFDPLTEIFAACAANPPPTSAPGQMQIPNIPVGTEARMDLVLAMIESSRLSSSFTQTKRFLVVGTGQMNEPLIRDETLAQGWADTRAP
jgi:hypothetical protein